MKIIFKEKAREEFLALEKQLQAFFKKHMEKVSLMPPRRHLRLGVPYHVENVTKQARFSYNIEGDLMTIIRCFSDHKEYEKWYESFK